MKKIFLVISIITVLFLAGCNTKNQQEEIIKDDLNNQNQQEEVISDSHILNMSFEERTKSFFDKKEEVSGDRLKRNFGNVRLIKNENHYELKADLIGDAKIDTMVLDNAINEIKENKLSYKEIELVNGEKVVIYSSRPQEIIDLYAKFENVIPTYDDSDWKLVKSNEEWLNKDGIPMYVKYTEEWAIVNKKDDGYYLYGRSTAGRTMKYTLIAVNEADAITINLLADDKIALDVNNLNGIYDEEYNPRIITVEEYYNLSFKDEDGLIININDMSIPSYDANGLEISEGVIHVVAKNTEP